jgi:hypothetical protein
VVGRWINFELEHLRQSISGPLHVGPKLQATQGNWDSIKISHRISLVHQLVRHLNRPSRYQKSLIGKMGPANSSVLPSKHLSRHAPLNMYLGLLFSVYGREDRTRSRLWGSHCRAVRWPLWKTEARGRKPGMNLVAETLRGLVMLNESSDIIASG